MMFFAAVHESAYDPKRTSVGIHLGTTGVPVQPATIRLCAVGITVQRQGAVEEDWGS
jgi:hypothetical protein